MKIRLSNAGKRFNREWIFRKADLEFKSSHSYAVTGTNGSGKSTLLQCLGGMLQLSEGSISYERESSVLKEEQVYQQISFCAPYLDVIEEMTLLEFFRFHTQFKSLIPGMTIQQVIEKIGLPASAEKQIGIFSSGMKQRVKLAQAIFTSTDVVLLDEPCTNLDANGIALYHQLIKEYCMDRLVIVCSNDEVEYSFCKEVLSIRDQAVVSK